jgi:hypothetical protein
MIMEWHVSISCTPFEAVRPDIMYKTGCIIDGGKRKILKGFPKETIELSEEQPNPADIKFDFHSVQ